MKIVATVEARMASTRLPGKTMMKILGKPMLELLIERVKRSKLIDDIIIATTTNAQDKVIVDLAGNIGVKSFRGSEGDVLDRVLKAAKYYNGNIIVELTGDCPLLDHAIIDKVIEKYLENDYDYVSNILERTFPRGLDTQVFSVDVLEEVSRITNDPADRENVSLYIYEHPEKYKLLNVKAPPELNSPELRLTVDTVEDFKLIKIIFKGLYLKNPAFGARDVIEFLDENSQLKEINSMVKQKPVRWA